MSNKNASEDLSRWDKIGWDEMRAFISPRVSFNVCDCTAAEGNSTFHY